MAPKRDASAYLMTPKQKSDAGRRMSAIRANLRDVAHAIHRDHTAGIDPEIIIELRGDLEQLLELIGRAES